MVLVPSATAGGVPLVLARLVEGLSTHQCAGGPWRLEDRRNCSQVSPCAGRLPPGRGPNADRPLWLPGRTRWCPRSGRDGHAAAHIDQGALRQQVQRGIERMQAVVTAPRAAQTHNLHRAGGRFGVAILLAPRRALDTTGVLGRTGNLSRAALVVMSLQELAYQLLAPPVQFPFEFALAHLPGFVGGEEGFGIREDSIGRCARGRVGISANVNTDFGEREHRFRRT